jgi:hypothetical protein
VLNRLRIGDDGCVQHRLVLDFAGGLVGFLNDAVDRRAFRAARLLAELCKGLLEALDLLVLLALNSTIEAARAGEAGPGMAYREC